MITLMSLLQQLLCRGGGSPGRRYRQSRRSCSSVRSPCSAETTSELPVVLTAARLKQPRTDVPAAVTLYQAI